MGLTPIHQLPYPEDTDPADVPADVYELANRLDTVLAALTLRQDTRIAELENTIGELRALLGDALVALAQTADV